MKGRKFVALLAAFCCGLTLNVAAVPEREVLGVSMPEVISADDRELRLNGLGVFKEKTFFKVYVVGLYLEKPTADARAAITTDEAKRIVLVMLRDVSRDMFVQAACATRACRCQPCMCDSICWDRRCPHIQKDLHTVRQET